MVARGDVWRVRLDPTVGSEQRGLRPALVVSPPELNLRVRTVIVAPLTTKSRPAPFRIALDFHGRRGLVLLDHLRAVDGSRLVDRLGSIDDAVLRETLSRLQEIFAA